MSGDDLEELASYVGGLLARHTPAERRKLAQAVAVDLRRANVGRIAAQRNPDGSAFEPRKKRPPVRGKGGRVKRTAAAMFRKLRRPAYLGLRASAAEASVGFFNATAARIARVHQHGMRDRVERRAGAAEVAYPVRQLLGVTDEDRARILDAVLAHLEP